MARLKDILQQQRKLNFVGRQNELNYFNRLLKEAQPAVHLLYIHGPGGQGKTTLLKQFGDLAKESAVPVIQIDCRYIEPFPESFKQLFIAAASFFKGKDVLQAIEETNTRYYY